MNQPALLKLYRPVGGLGLTLFAGLSASDSAFRFLLTAELGTEVALRWLFCTVGVDLSEEVGVYIELPLRGSPGRGRIFLINEAETCLLTVSGGIMFAAWKLTLSSL